MVSEGDDRSATTPPADSRTVPASYQDWAPAVQVFYSGGPAVPGNPQMFYSSSPSLPPFVWGAQAMTMGTTTPHSPMFMHGGVYSHQAAQADETSETVEREAKRLSEGDHDNGGKGASGSDTCNESGGEESSKTSRDDDLSASGKGALSPRPSFSKDAGRQPWSSHKKRVLEDFREMQDDHEEKREKRKQSNRESARRSRERRQKECEILTRQVAELNANNADLRKDIEQLHAECNRVGAENASIMEELKALYGPSELIALGVDL